MHHADTAGPPDLEALRDPVDDAAVALDDLAGGLRRVERAGRAAASRWRRLREASLTLTDVTNVVAVVQRTRWSTRPRSAAPLPSSTAWKARRNVAAATVVTHGAGWSSVLAPGAAVAGRVGDEDAGVGRAAERLRDRVERVGLGRCRRSSS